MKRHGLLQTLQRTPGELVDGINNTRGHARLCHQAADVCCGVQLGLRHAAATAAKQSGNHGWLADRKAGSLSWV